MNDTDQRLSSQEIVEQLPAGWALLGDGVQTRIKTGDLAIGVALVDGIAAAAQALGHDPVLTLRADTVDVRLTTPEAHWVTGPDLRLAADITTLVEQSGLAVSVDGASWLEMGLDTPDRAAIAPFWAVVLGGDYSSSPTDGDEVRDPAGALPTVWFQPSGTDEPRQRWHPDLWCDPADVPARIEAAVAAGGTLVSDEEAPAFWVLADPEGNKVCLCTWETRD